MKIRKAGIFAIVACSAYALCVGSGIAQSDAGQRVPQLKTYTFGDIGTSQYEVVGRLPVDSWRSAFRLPTFDSEDEARAALNAEATQRGADGLLNVLCLDQSRGKLSWRKEPGFLCYGVAIRVRAGQG